MRVRLGCSRVERSEDAQAADLVAAMNAAFDLREHAGHLESEHALALVAQALGEAPSIRAL